MANLKLINPPKDLYDKIRELSKKLVIEQEVLLSGIIQYAMENKDKFEIHPLNNPPGNEKQTIEIIIPIGTLDIKKDFLRWGFKHGRTKYSIQTLFVILKFFEFEEELPKKYLDRSIKL